MGSAAPESPWLPLGGPRTVRGHRLMWPAPMSCGCQRSNVLPTEIPISHLRTSTRPLITMMGKISRRYFHFHPLRT